MGQYRFFEVAERTGFSTSTLRFYEQVGVLAETDEFVDRVCSEAPSDLPKRDGTWRV